MGYIDKDKLKEDVHELETFLEEKVDATTNYEKQLLLSKISKRLKACSKSSNQQKTGYNQETNTPIDYVR